MAKARDFGPVGIIDIGSNSVRLVAYGGSERVPSALYNEKVMAGLGRTLGENGELSQEAMDLVAERQAAIMDGSFEVEVNDAEPTSD